MLLIVTFCIRHALSGVALSDLLTLVELHCLLPNHCAKTTKLLREVFGKVKSPIELHYYCSFCQEYFGTQKPSCCSNTACLLDSEKKRLELQYFIIIPFITQCEICRSHVFPGVCNLHKHYIFFVCPFRLNSGSFVLNSVRLKIEAQPGLGILKYNKKRSLAKNFLKKNISFRLSIYSLPRIKR